jgi:hypothetical protein
MHRKRDVLEHRSVTDNFINDDLADFIATLAVTLPQDFDFKLAVRVGEHTSRQMRRIVTNAWLNRRQGPTIESGS